MKFAKGVMGNAVLNMNSTYRYAKGLMGNAVDCKLNEVFGAVSSGFMS